MATYKDVLSKAASQIGYKEYPSGSNKTKYGVAYGMNGVPWCAMFVWWNFKQVNASGLYFGGGKTAYTPTLAQYYKNRNRWYHSPKAGDLVFFHNGTRICHVGFVEKVIDSDTIQTIEGNTGVGNDANGGAVMRRQRSIKGTSSWHVAGFARPAYTPILTKPKPFNLTRSLSQGMQGDDVGRLQMRLNSLKITSNDGHSVKVDKQFGVKTKEAVKKFQKRKSIKVTGIVTMATAHALGWLYKGK